VQACNCSKAVFFWGAVSPIGETGLPWLKKGVAKGVTLFFAGSYSATKITMEIKKDKIKSFLGIIHEQISQLWHNTFAQVPHKHNYTQTNKYFI